mmetsp:Transcript_113255/g.283653  ORF Transcript_113255/g.283653 Transcript_113255/m.283653 type:complete len:664 (+) Transcript_113255:117-2108(+)
MDEVSRQTVQGLVENGIKLKHLLELYTNHKHRMSRVDLTTGEFCEEIIKPLTEDDGGKSYVEYVGDPAIARHHVIHSWRTEFRTLLEGVVKHAIEVKYGKEARKEIPRKKLLDIEWIKTQRPKSLKESFFICTCVVNQHQMDAPNRAWGSPQCQIDKFHAVAREIHARSNQPLVVVLEKSGQVFSRAQCLSELHAAFTHEPKIPIVLTGKEFLQFNTESIDAASAQAYSDRIVRDIRQSIEAMEGGYAQFDLIVKENVQNYIDKNKEEAKVDTHKTTSACHRLLILGACVAVLVASAVAMWGIDNIPLIGEPSYHADNYVFVGNPGTGKSTLLNSLIGRVAFESGISVGQGFTKALHIATDGKSVYMDTPGLDDPVIREQAAKEITQALMKEGTYKVFFVVTDVNGRVRPADQTTMRLVLASAPRITHYGVIINQVEKHVARKLRTNRTEWEMMQTYLMSSHDRPTNQFIIIERQEILAGIDNALWRPTQEFLRFVSNTRSMEIGRETLLEIQIENYTQMLKDNEENNRKLKEDHDRMRVAMERLSGELQRKSEEDAEEREKLEAARKALEQKLKEQEKEASTMEEKLNLLQERAKKESDNLQKDILALKEEAKASSIEQEAKIKELQKQRDDQDREIKILAQMRIEDCKKSAWFWQSTDHCK